MASEGTEIPQRFCQCETMRNQRERKRWLASGKDWLERQEAEEVR